MELVSRLSVFACSTAGRADLYRPFATGSSPFSLFKPLPGLKGADSLALIIYRYPAVARMGDLLGYVVGQALRSPYSVLILLPLPTVHAPEPHSEFEDARLVISFSSLTLPSLTSIVVRLGLR